tara:strand:- start:177 stop:608 length:432 start_codon:yes stop_codon:yes gene_type:complete
MSNEEEELPCLREKDTGDGEWTCVHDHTGCLYNNGHNECGHEGDSTQPLEENLLSSTGGWGKPKQLEVTTEWCVEDVRHNFGELVADLSDDEIWERLYRLGGAFEEACIDSGWTVIQNCFITGDDTDIWQVNLRPKNNDDGEK